MDYKVYLKSGQRISWNAGMSKDLMYMTCQHIKTLNLDLKRVSIPVTTHSNGDP